MTEPILVAGAGPVGLTAALMIARHEVPVRIVDASDGPTDLSKALVVWRRTLETLDAEIPYADVAAGHGELRRARIDLGERVEEIPIDDGGDGRASRPASSCPRATPSASSWPPSSGGASGWSGAPA